MTLATYKILHLSALVLTMLGIGGMLNADKGEKPPRLAMILHGAGVLALLVAGFGVMAKSGIMAPHDWPAWLILKMVVWFFVAAMPALLRHGTVPRAAGWIVVLLLAAAAAYLCIEKPTFA